jgi:hypothetical protein
MGNSSTHGQGEIGAEATAGERVLGSKRSFTTATGSSPVPENFCWPPVTRPCLATHCQASIGEPPLQPSSEEQKHMCSAESGTMLLPSVEMHMRSEAASAVPKALPTYQRPFIVKIR